MIIKNAIQAARAEKYMFCEKPVDLDVKTNQNVIKMMDGFNRLFDSNFMKIKQMVVDGKSDQYLF